jgi:hypothetical protein
MTINLSIAELVVRRRKKRDAERETAAIEAFRQRYF